jgi:hypothetical protein
MATIPKNHTRVTAGLKDLPDEPRTPEEPTDARLAAQAGTYVSWPHSPEEPWWRCEDCGWPWPLAGRPPETAECDACGGTLTLVTGSPS